MSWFAQKLTHMYFSKTSLGKNEWWRYLLFILAVVLSVLVGQAPILLIMYAQKDKLNLSENEFQEIWDSGDLQAFQLTENQVLLLILLAFVPAFIAIFFLIKKLHQKSFLSLVTGRKRFDTKRTFIGFSIWMILATVVIFSMMPETSYIYQFSWDTFIPLVIISLLLFPIQVAFEEILIRGYLMQGTFLIFKNKIFPLVFTSLVFALLHLANPEFQNGVLNVIPAYLLLSFMFGFITVLDNGLELPLGIHTANNLFVALILSASDGSLKTPSIFKTDTSALLSTLTIALPIIVILTFTILSITYKWKRATLKVSD